MRHRPRRSSAGDGGRLLDEPDELRQLGVAFGVQPLGDGGDVRGRAAGLASPDALPQHLGEFVITTSCWKRGEVVSEPSARRWGHVTKTAFAGALPIGEDPELNQLTAREREVMRLIALGHTYKEAAQRLDISVKTMERHVSAVLRKLQLSNRHQLARWAADRGIV